MQSTDTEIISYKEEITEILERLPVITYRQLKFLLIRLLGTQNGSDIFQAVHRLEVEGTVLISENGFVTTKKAIDIVANGNYQRAFSGARRISRMKVNTFFYECIQCFGIVLSMYPYSKQFQVKTDTFPISFTHTGRDLDYELIRIPKNLDRELAEKIKKESITYMEEKNNEKKERLRRIALVESEAAASYVPYCGFKFICVYDSKEKLGFRIVEKRDGDLWKDLKEG